MTATIQTLFNEFPLLFVVRVGLSLILLFTLIMLAVILYKHDIINKIQRNSFVVLSSYAVALFYFTIFGRYSQSYYRYELNIFASYRQIFESYDTFTLYQIIVNLTIFIPISFLLCMIIKTRFKNLWAMLISTLFIIFIEALQFVSRCGTFEADDLINNTISAVLGIGLYISIKNMFVLEKIMKNESINKIYIKIKKLKLKNKKPSVIASNCNGAFILHDLGLRFNSPFVNLWIKPSDYLKLLQNFDKYMQADIIEITEEGINYPIGRLIDINIYFQHYASFQEAVDKWKERRKRIDLDNLFILFTDRDGCTIDDLIVFDSLPFKNKVVFTNKKYSQIKSAFYISGFENLESVGHCFEYMPNKKGKKYYDQFDYVNWFNNGIKRKY